MKHRRICWLGVFIPLGAILTPVLLWALIVVIAPTNWARTHVAAVLERSSGRSVRIDDLDACLLGGINLIGLRIGRTRAPWRTRGSKFPRCISTSACSSSSGARSSRLISRSRAERCAFFAGATARSSLADLVRPERGHRSTTAEPRHRVVSKLKVKLSDIQVIVVDNPTQTQVTFDDVEGEGNCEDEGHFVVNLSGHLNQGPFQFTAHLDRSTEPLSFEGEFRTSEVVLDHGMGILRYLVPVLVAPRGIAGADGHGYLPPRRGPNKRVRLPVAGGAGQS